MKNRDNKIGYLNDNFKIFHIKDKKDTKFEYHHHDFNKIIIFISGDVTYFVEGKSYKLKPWDILFVNNQEIHKPVVNPDEYYERIAIWISPDFMKKYCEDQSNLLRCFEISSTNKCNLLRLNVNCINKIKTFVTNIKDNENNDEFGSDILKNALFLQLMVFINRLFLQDNENVEYEDIQYDETIENLLAYINNNLSNNLSIDSLATEFFTSKYYLMRKFKSQTGSSIHNYIVQKRLILAKSLIHQGLSMADVCTKSGFNDYSSFVRSFKKTYGVSPKNYLNSTNIFDNKFSNE